MATYYARKTGNINAADVWATTPTGTASNLYPTFTNADVLMSNSFLVTVNVNTTVNTCRGDTFGGASTGGQFLLNNGITLNSNVTSGGSFHCVGASYGSSTIVGSVSNFGVDVNGTGTISIIGNVSGTSTNGARVNSPTATINITGNVTGGAQIGVNVASGTLNITGNVTGGTAANIYGVSNAGVGTINVTGNITGGTVVATSHGLSNGTTGICTIVGICTGGPNGSSGANNASTGTVRATRAVGNAYGPSNSAGLAAAVGISNVALGICEIEQLEYGTFGMSPTSGTGIRLKNANTNVAVFNYCDTAGAKTLIDATANAAMPAASNVRSGVSYASGAITGSCAVPAAGSVAFGVPVDATTGTAVLDVSAVAAAVWGAASRTITGGTVTTLTNAPTSVTPSDIWSHAARTLTSASGPSATDIRQELDTNSTKLANLDATISSRLASSVSTNITAIKAKTDLLNTDRLGQVATTSIVGNLIAQSNS